MSYSSASSGKNSATKHLQTTLEQFGIEPRSCRLRPGDLNRAIERMNNLAALAQSDVCQCMALDFRLNRNQQNVNVLLQAMLKKTGMNFACFAITAACLSSEQVSITRPWPAFMGLWEKGDRTWFVFATSLGQDFGIIALPAEQLPNARGALSFDKSPTLQGYTPEEELIASIMALMDQFGTTIDSRKVRSYASIDENKQFSSMLRGFVF